MPKKKYPSTRPPSVRLSHVYYKGHFTATYAERLKEAKRLSILSSLGGETFAQRANKAITKNKLNFELGSETQSDGNCFYNAILQAIMDDEEMTEEAKKVLCTETLTLQHKDLLKVAIISYLYNHLDEIIYECEGHGGCLSENVQVQRKHSKH